MKKITAVFFLGISLSCHAQIDKNSPFFDYLKSLYAMPIVSNPSHDDALQEANHRIQLRRDSLNQAYFINNRQGGFVQKLTAYAALGKLSEIIDSLKPLSPYEKLLHDVALGKNSAEHACWVMSYHDQLTVADYRLLSWITTNYQMFYIAAGEIEYIIGPDGIGNVLKSVPDIFYKTQPITMMVKH